MTPPLANLPLMFAVRYFPGPLLIPPVPIAHGEHLSNANRLRGIRFSVLTNRFRVPQDTVGRRF